MLGRARTVAAARHRHVSRHQLISTQVRHTLRHPDRYRLYCSQSTGEWQAGSDGDWGSKVAGPSAEVKPLCSRPRDIVAVPRATTTTSETLRCLSTFATTKAHAPFMAMPVWHQTQAGEQTKCAAGKPLESIPQEPTGHAQPAKSIERGNPETGGKDRAGDSQASESIVHSPSDPGQDDTASAPAANASGVESDADQTDSARGGADHLRKEQADPGMVEWPTATDQTQEPLLQHLFEDLEHRHPDKTLAIANESVQFDETPTIGFNSNGVDASMLEKEERSGREAQAPAATAEEPADELGVKHSDIDELGSLTGHDELQQRAALAVRAAHAALRACESASAHSAASCRAASEAASAANNATHAASQALTSAERGASEDLERALRRVQHAQQQARDAEAAAATAATSADAKATTAAEQEKLAQKAASPQVEEVDEQESVADKVKAAALRSKMTITAWLQAFCTWCANAWQAFLAWTSRVGEHVQRLISRRQ